MLLIVAGVKQEVCDVLTDEGFRELQRFDVSRVLRQGASLLASEGEEFNARVVAAGEQCLFLALRSHPKTNPKLLDLIIDYFVFL